MINFFKYNPCKKIILNYVYFRNFDLLLKSINFKDSKKNQFINPKLTLNKYGNNSSSQWRSC